MSLLASRAFVAVAVFALTTLSAAGQSVDRADHQTIRARIEAFLGGYETAIGPQQWRKLGDAAIPILESIADDPTALPTRRARSLDGLAALATSEPTMRRLANSAAD